MHSCRITLSESVSKSKSAIKKLCHSERSEESQVHKVGVIEILRYALDDKNDRKFLF